MVKVGIIGASGYTGVELARLICRHPGAELTVATSRQYAGLKLSAVYPSLLGVTDVICRNISGSELAEQADLFFTAVPHQTAMAIVPRLLEAGKKVIDLSADFRIHDAGVYEQWYQVHSAPEYLAEAVYGLPELHRRKISNARLVANPGCYPTSIILALAPLLQAGVIKPGNLIIDAKSGAAGAGRSAKVAALYCEVNDGFMAYKVGEHRHTPEIEQELSQLADTSLTISFTPHLLPMSRGILSTIYADLLEDIDAAAIRKLYDDLYHDEPFIRLCPAGQLPAPQFVRGSNFCDIGFKIDSRTGRIIVLSAIDNLVKGAAGQAVQNMNLISGFIETDGLLTIPLFP